MAKRTAVCVTIDNDVLARIDALAAGHELRRGDIITRLLRNGLPGMEEQLTALKNPIIGPVLGAMAKKPVAEFLLNIFESGMSPEDRKEFLKNVDRNAQLSRKLRGKDLKLKAKSEESAETGGQLGNG